MDKNKLARKKEILLAKRAIEEAGLYIVQEKDYDYLAEMSVESYRNYPLYDWLTQGNYDEYTLKLLMLITMRTMTKSAVIYADSEEMNGLAVWLPFGFSGNKVMPFLMNGGLKLIFHAGLGFTGRLISYEDYAMKLKKEFTNHYDWYLFNLYIKKEAQGKGIASKLMRPMLQFCDEERMLAYLETNKAANVGLYQHFGFDLMKEDMIPKSSVKHYAMLRRPKYEKNENEK